MSYRFECPKCGLFSKVDESLIGKEKECEFCGKTILVPIPDNYASAPDNNPAMENKKKFIDLKCPNCNSTIKTAEECVGMKIVCTSCNKTFVLRSSPVIQIAKKCPSCGYTYNSESKTCSKCGYNFQAGKPGKSIVEQNRPTRSTKKKMSSIRFPIKQIFNFIVFIIILAGLTYYFYIPGDVEINGVDFLKKFDEKKNLEQIQYLQPYLQWRKKKQRSLWNKSYLNFTFDEAKKYEVFNSINGDKLFPNLKNGQQPSRDIKHAANGAVLTDFSNYLKKSPDSGIELLDLAIKTGDKDFLIQIIDLFYKHDLISKMSDQLLNLYNKENDLSVKKQILDSLKLNLTGNVALVKKLFDFYESEENPVLKKQILVTIIQELGNYPDFVEKLLNSYFTEKNPELKKQILKSVNDKLDKHPIFFEKLLRTYFTENDPELKKQILKCARGKLDSHLKFVKKLLKSYNKEKDLKVKALILSAMASTLNQSKSLDKSILALLVEEFNKIIEIKTSKITIRTDSSQRIKYVEAVLKNKNIPVKHLIRLSKKTKNHQAKSMLANALIPWLKTNNPAQRILIFNYLMNLINNKNNIRVFYAKTLAANNELSSKDIQHIIKDCKYGDSKYEFSSILIARQGNNFNDKDNRQLVVNVLNSSNWKEAADKLFTDKNISVKKLLYFYKKCRGTDVKSAFFIELLTKINHCKDSKLVDMTAKAIAPAIKYNSINKSASEVYDKINPQIRTIIEKYLYGKDWKVTLNSKILLLRVAGNINADPFKRNKAIELCLKFLIPGNVWRFIPFAPLYGFGTQGRINPENLHKAALNVYLYRNHLGEYRKNGKKFLIVNEKQGKAKIYFEKTDSFSLMMEPNGSFRMSWNNHPGTWKLSGHIIFLNYSPFGVGMPPGPPPRPKLKVEQIIDENLIVARNPSPKNPDPFYWILYRH